MNKKGFTLVELLAVIALVAILSGLAVTNIISATNNNKQNTFLMDAKRMVAKAESFMSQSRSYRETAKNLGGLNIDFAKLNEKEEFPKDPDGGNYSTSSFVKVRYNSSTKQYTYCICLMGSQRKIGGNCELNNEPNCVLSTNLTDISVVTNLEADPVDIETNTQSESEEESFIVIGELEESATAPAY